MQTYYRTEREHLFSTVETTRAYTNIIPHEKGVPWKK